MPTLARLAGKRFGHCLRIIAIEVLAMASPRLLLLLLSSVILAQQPLAQTSAPTLTDSGNAPGKVIGAKVSELPSWFKESFLEIAEDVEEASAGGKHVMLYFHLEGCPYCDKMVEENFKHSPYSDFLQENFDAIEINIKGDREVAFNEEVSLSEKELARHLKVRYTPTIIFLDAENAHVLRLNGYRSVDGFKHAIDYVHEKAYQRTKLSRYIEERVDKAMYALRDHPNFAAVDDLSSVPDKPLMVLFEDRTCDECDALHENILNLDDTLAILDRFTVVRLDALSDAPLSDVSGNPTTAKDYGDQLGISYRPGVVLFDRGQEIMRIDGMQRTFHFQEVLRYVGERQYERYPKFRDYMAAREEAILGSGQDIDIWK